MGSSTAGASGAFSAAFSTAFRGTGLVYSERLPKLLKSKSWYLDAAFVAVSAAGAGTSGALTSGREGTSILGASNLGASNLGASNLGASNLGASNLGASPNLGASALGSSMAGASDFGWEALNLSRREGASTLGGSGAELPPLKLRTVGGERRGVSVARGDARREAPGSCRPLRYPPHPGPGARGPLAGRPRRSPDVSCRRPGVAVSGAGGHLSKREGPEEGLGPFLVACS